MQKNDRKGIFMYPTRQEFNLKQVFPAGRAAFPSSSNSNSPYKTWHRSNVNLLIEWANKL